MPTSSQSQILSVVDYQLLQQQQPSNGQTTTIKPTTRTVTNQSSTVDNKRRTQKDDRRTSIDKKNENDHSPPPPPSSAYATDRRRSTDKTNDTTRTSQRNDVLHMPVINLNENTRRSSLNNDNRQIRTIKSTNIDQHQLNSDNDDLLDNEYRSKQKKNFVTSQMTEGNISSTSDIDDADDDADDDDDDNGQSSLLDANARRLLVLGTIRPSKTFYRNLPEADVKHLMDYFRRMKQTQQRITSDEINQELATKYVEYKPKMFFDSACVTKGQVATIEKLIEQYADQIRMQKAEFVKLENPMRFVIKSINDNKPLTTIPREYNDCFITLVTRSDPLRKSELITGLVHEKFLEDVKANSLDISYFPGGVNYDVPRDEIDENGQMNEETYQKLKKRLNNRKVWYFNNPPEKKPNALLAIIPIDSTINIDHQKLYQNLYDRLKIYSTNNIEQRILSIEFVPLSCILNTYDISNQFIIDCDSLETKRQLLEEPLKITSNKQSITLEFQSYDEIMQREYEKYIKSEKYRELIKTHDAAVKRLSTKK